MPVFRFDAGKEQLACIHKACESLVFGTWNVAEMFASFGKEDSPFSDLSDF